MTMSLAQVFSILRVTISLTGWPALTVTSAGTKPALVTEISITCAAGLGAAAGSTLAAAGGAALVAAGGALTGAGLSLASKVAGTRSTVQWNTTTISRFMMPSVRDWVKQRYHSATAGPPGSD